MSHRILAPTSSGLVTRRLYRPARSVCPTQTRSLKLFASSKHALRRSTCLITGASRGIGRAIAIAFAREGARCLLVGRDETALKETYDLCTSARGSIGRSHFVLTGDIKDQTFWSALDKSPCWGPENGRLDVLVNAAAKVDDILNTNLSSAIQASRFATKKMLKNSAEGPNGAGHILNISSLLATHGGAGSVAYAASKAGVLGLTRSLAAELGTRGIRVNAICPGYVETDMTRAMPYTAREAAFAKIPTGRFGTVDEVADAAVFLCGNQYANNTVLNLDGGLSAV
ncbi:NAD(P)-binding protein [Aureobasidium sp. EXF-8845]|nr:NAD(P)-binding protein [Aureobasidium sp. EXF-8845]KAI4854889.1 NAD(P)-binding protein [Aureobasidium sp. EXF-8846]